MPVFLAFWSGFTSLSLEIVWSKLVGFRLFSLPQAFSIVLLSYLLGIAAGSWIGRRCCSGNSDLMLVSAKFLVMAGVIDILTPFFYPISVELWPVLPTTMVLIFVGAMLKGVVFPIAHHLGSMNAEKTSLGRSISNVYFANVLGATFGPVFVGFFLLDFVGIQKAFVLLGGSLVLLGVYIFYRQKAYINSIGACAALLVLLFWGGVSPSVLLPSLIRNEHGAQEPLVHLIENRYGIIYTLGNLGAGDVIFGGNVYDGRINTDVALNSNKIDRAYVSYLLRPEASNILVIGLSGGAWVEAVRHFPHVKKIDVVELNPGYAELIKRYASVAGLLVDEKVNLYFADGRKWLHASNEQYDIILMNTSFHWRAYSSNLLGMGFAEIVRAHLKKDGVFAFNSTWSPDSIATASSTFKYTFQYRNFIFASDSSLEIPIATATMEALLGKIDWTTSGNFREEVDYSKTLAKIISSEPILNVTDVEQKSGRRLRVITEENMLTEFKYGRSLLSVE